MLILNRISNFKLISPSGLTIFCCLGVDLWHVVCVCIFYVVVIVEPEVRVGVRKYFSLIICSWVDGRGDIFTRKKILTIGRSYKTP